MEQVGQDGCGRASTDQALGLESLNRRLPKPFSFGVEQTAPRPADAVGGERLLELLGLQQDGKTRERAFADRRRGQRSERRPDMLLGLRIDRDAFGSEDRGQPFGRPCPFGGIVDMGERLELHAVAGLVGEHPAEILPVAAHADRGSADAAAEIEGEYLAVLVTAELHRHQREQHRLARAGRPDDQRMANIADMKGKPERGRAFGLAVEQGGSTEMLVPFRPRPYC